MIGKKVKLLVRAYSPLVITAIDESGNQIEKFKSAQGEIQELILEIPESTSALSYSYQYGNKIYEIQPYTE